MTTAEDYRSHAAETAPKKPAFSVSSSERALAVKTARAAAQRWGDKFWGIDSGTPLMPIPPTLDNRMGVLRSGLRLMHDRGVSLDEPAKDWMTRKKNSAQADIKVLMNRKVRLSGSVNTEFDGLYELPRTVGEAFAKPVIAEDVRERLNILGSPLIVLSDSFEAAARAEVTDGNRTLGYTALDSFLFAAGDKPFIDLVKQTATDFYEAELLRRQISQSEHVQ